MLLLLLNVLWLEWMCDDCTWHHITFLVQSLYWHLAIKLYCCYCYSCRRFLLIARRFSCSRFLVIARQFSCRRFLAIARQLSCSRFLAMARQLSCSRFLVMARQLSCSRFLVMARQLSCSRFLFCFVFPSTSSSICFDSLYEKIRLCPLFAILTMTRLCRPVLHGCSVDLANTSRKVGFLHTVFILGY